mmetsp:Transcript_58342/g.94385  ORF Transcript_58342/g.94385 Transcript_58342/m.94385 type:complete len:260 (-) Transcript_58342:119-898(-)
MPLAKAGHVETLLVIQFQGFVHHLQSSNYIFWTLFPDVFIQTLEPHSATITGLDVGGPTGSAVTHEAIALQQLLLPLLPRLPQLHVMREELLTCGDRLGSDEVGLSSILVPALFDIRTARVVESAHLEKQSHVKLRKLTANSVGEEDAFNRLFRFRDERVVQGHHLSLGLWSQALELRVEHLTPGLTWLVCAAGQHRRFCKDDFTKRKVSGCHRRKATTLYGNHLKAHARLRPGNCCCSGCRSCMATTNRQKSISACKG